MVSGGGFFYISYIITYILASHASHDIESNYFRFSVSKIQKSYSSLTPREMTKQQQERPNAIVAFFSGGIAGVIEIVITCTYILHFYSLHMKLNVTFSLDPFEFVKSTLQLEQKKYGGQLWKFKDLVKQEGMLV